MTVNTFSSLINPKLDGTTLLTEVSMSNKTLDKVNITQSTFITTISTLTPMSNQEKQEESQVQTIINSSKKESSVMNQDGDQQILK